MFNFPDDFPKISEVSQDEESQDVVTLNGQRYLFSAILDNGDQVITLPNKYLDNLILNDSFLGFMQTGVLNYHDPNNTISSLINKLNNLFGEDCVNQNINESDVSSFTFRGSGNERLHLKFVPIITNSEKDGLGKLENKYNNGEWLIMQTFVITELSNPVSSLSKNKFELKFEGIESHTLKNYRISNFPSHLVGRSAIGMEETIPRTRLTNYEVPNANKLNSMACKTGEGIYWIINKAFEEFRDRTNFDITGYLPEIIYNSDGNYEVAPSEKVGRKVVRELQNGVTRTRRQDKSNYDVWDFGSDDSVYLTQLGNKERTMHLIMRYLEFHVSEHQGNLTNSNIDSNSLGGLNYDPCILKLARPNSERDNPRVTMRPFVSYFDNVGRTNGTAIGNEFMDMFYLKVEDNSNVQNLGVIKGFLNTVTGLCDDDEGTSKQTTEPIKGFSFDPIEPNDSNNFLVSHIVEYRGDDAPRLLVGMDGEFNNTKQYIAEQYLSRLIPDKTTTEDRGFGLVNIDDDSNIKQGDSAIYKIECQVPTVPAFIAKGRNKLINRMIFFNDAITFSSTGSTHRQSGKFFSVDITEGSDPEDENLNRMLGVYWAAHVTHEINFKSKTYNNELTGVKFYRYADPSNS